MKLLIVIDMQNNFIDGSLGTKEAVAIVPNVARKLPAPLKRQMYLKAGALALSAFLQNVMNMKQKSLSSLKLVINYKDKILEYLSKHSKVRSQDIALFIGLK